MSHTIANTKKRTHKRPSNVSCELRAYKDKCWKLGNSWKQWKCLMCHINRKVLKYKKRASFKLSEFVWRCTESRMVYLSNAILVMNFENCMGALFFGANSNWQYNFMRRDGNKLCAKRDFSKKKFTAVFRFAQ